jgi:hypothetical protein
LTQAIVGFRLIKYRIGIEIYPNIAPNVPSPHTNPGEYASNSGFFGRVEVDHFCGFSQEAKELRNYCLYRITAKMSIMGSLGFPFFIKKVTMIVPGVLVVTVLADPVFREPKRDNLFQ